MLALPSLGGAHVGGGFAGEMHLSTEADGITPDHTRGAAGTAECLWVAVQQWGGGPPRAHSPVDRCRLPLWVPGYRSPYPRGADAPRGAVLSPHPAEPGLQLRPWHLWPLRGTVGPRMARPGRGRGTTRTRGSRSPALRLPPAASDPAKAPDPPHSSWPPSPAGCLGVCRGCGQPHAACKGVTKAEDPIGCVGTQEQGALCWDGCADVGKGLEGGMGSPSSTGPQQRGGWGCVLAWVFSGQVGRVGYEAVLLAEGVNFSQVFSLLFPPPRSGRTPCPGHSSEGFPLLALGMATSSSTAQPERLAWRISPKATSNGSTSKAVPSPRAPSCLPPAASSLPSTGTVSSPPPQPCTPCVPGDGTPPPQLDAEGCLSLK